jgi:RHS repeat-associated protein
MISSRFLASALALALTATLSDIVVQPRAAEAAPAQPATKPRCVRERPDATSAVLTAKLCGHQVEVLDRRTETTQLWALPEGGFTTQVYAGPVRFHSEGSWRPVDLTLQRQPDGSVAPVGHPAGLRIAGRAKGKARELAGVDIAGDRLSMGWDGPLPDPELDRNVATYRGVRPGVDLVVTATRTGFEQSLIVQNRAAAAGVASLTLPLRSRKLSFESDGPGSLSIKDKKGRTVARVPGASMWDAQRGRDGEPVREKALSVRTIRSGSSAGLQVHADLDWLNDPKTKYPVEIDPAVDIDPSSDTLVRSTIKSTDPSPIDHSAANQLEIGKSSTYLSRSFMKWPTTQFAGGNVRSATLKLWNWYAGSCSQAGWWAYTTAPYSNPIYWDTQPARLHDDGYSTQTAGYDSSCNDNWIGIDVRTFFQRAADARAPEAHMGLRAYDEVNIRSSWKQVRSLQAANNAEVPYVQVTYDAMPTVSDLQARPGSGGCASGADRPYVTSLTPQLRATSADSDGTTVTTTFEWATADRARIGGTTVAGVPSGTVASTAIPAGVLAEGGTYAWRAQATDGLFTSPWSAWCEFTVDTAKPRVPFVSSATYPPTTTSNTWGHGGAGQAADFTFTPVAADIDVVAFVYQQDTDTASTTVTSTSTTPTVVSITPKEDGRRTLTVYAKDRAGNLSEPLTYTFNVGRAGLKLPAAGANVVRRMKLAIDGDATYTGVRFRYRRGPGAAEHDVPLANLSKGDGTPVTGYPLAIAQLQPYAVWNAVETLGSVGGVVQVSAKLYTGSTEAYQTQWTTVAVDPNGDGGAATEAGPASVNLLTGDATLSASDVDEFGLTVSRVASSREPADGWVPQGERLTPAQQQVTDLTGFSGGGNATLERRTTAGQGSSTDSLAVIPARTGDTFAAVGAEYTMAQAMKPGRRYRATAWIFVPAATGLTGTADHRALSIAGFTYSGGAYQTVTSEKARYVDGWQELTVDLAVPANATQAFFRLYNGHAGGSGKVVWWDNISVRELVAPFGPQWRGGATDGVAESDYTTVEFPSTDVVKVSTTDGGWMTFGRNPAGQFFPEPGAEDLTLTRPDDATYRLTDLDGTVTDFVQQSGVFVATSSRTPDSTSTSRYVYESADSRTLVKRVINPVEPGVGDCAAATPARGCEVLEYEYASQTTATGTALGDIADQVKSVKVWSWDQDAGQQGAVEVARYLYDNQGRMRESWDPRTPSGPLKTRYEYDAAGRVTTLTPPGQLPWTFDMGAAAGDPDAGRLLRVRRAALRPGTRDQLEGEAVTTVVYGVPLTRGVGGPHDMDAAAVRRWSQEDLPTDATAVFGSETVPATSSATASVPGPNGYTDAAVHYLNASGQQVNTAAPGGHIDTTEYDEFGNAVRTLEATNRALALGTLPDAAAKAAELGLPADPALRADLLSTIHTYSPDGLDLRRTLGPVTRVALAEDLAADGRPTMRAGSPVIARPHTTIRHDEGRPDGATYHLETTRTTSAAVDGYPDADQRITRTGYAADKGGTSGWKLKKPTSTTTDAGTVHTVFDDAGRTVASWGLGATGTDARTTETIYYTAAANSADSACGHKPEWAGQPCVTKAAGAITGQRADMSTQLPVKRVERYSRSGDAAVIAETAQGSVRRTTTTPDAADRVIRVEITADQGIGVPAVITEYDTTTGQAVGTRAGSSTIVREYDLLGRLITYTDADSGTTRTEYDRHGKPIRTTDPTGTVAYGYDRAAEPRGLVTSVTDSVAGAFTARYSPDGQLTDVKLPGGITRHDTLDAGMAPVGRSYTRDSDGAVIYAESIVENTQGQWIQHAFTGGSRTADYDKIGRLTKAQQTDGTGACTTRAYHYDARTNRTRATAGACGDDTPDTSREHGYDTADRVTDAGYEYDAFGRTLAAPDGLINAYHVNDLAGEQRNGSVRQQWTLDPAHRFRGVTLGVAAGDNWQTVTTRLNRYGDDSDEPRWIVEDTATGTITRNVNGPDGDLAATTSRTGDVRLHLTNLHGDVVVTTDPALTAPEVSAYDEFGVPAAGQTDRRYGWLGGKQRSGEAVGDTLLMGVRLYSPGTGRFLQVDPVPGGSCNAYDYACADPINSDDIDGKRWNPCRGKRSNWCKELVRPAARGVERGWTRATNWTLRKVTAGVIWGGYQAYRVGRAARWVGRAAVKAWRSTGPWSWRTVTRRIGYGIGCVQSMAHYRPQSLYSAVGSFALGFFTNKPCQP